MQRRGTRPRVSLVLETGEQGIHRSTSAIEDEVRMLALRHAAPVLGVKPSQLEVAVHKIQVVGFPQRNMHIGDVADRADQRVARLARVLAKAGSTNILA